MLYGGGAKGWHQNAKDMLMSYMLETDPEAALQKVEEQMANHDVFIGQKFNDRVRLAVVSHPTAVSKKQEQKKWLEWWMGLLVVWGNRDVVALISPSTKNDPIVKMVAKSMGIKYVLTDPNARAASRHVDFKDNLEKLYDYKLREQGCSQVDPDFISHFELPMEKQKNREQVDLGMKTIGSNTSEGKNI